MRTIRNLISQEKKVYLLLKDPATRYRFMSDALREGIGYGDGVSVADRPVEDIMALRPDGTICFLGWAGHMCYHISKDTALRIDYEKYIAGAEDYLIPDRQ